ncbi:Wound-induced protein 1 [Apostasia shenzhenica]|uniref:Wound-induced protein 1 n=1 Tax=Apostasia shenzhenica TaxID=1088818 RepID=A0A2I0BHJ5_9ASPA|nr:Wound-induced protein 1 [Apostasia shenzhenica]
MRYYPGSDSHYQSTASAYLLPNKDSHTSREPRSRVLQPLLVLFAVISATKPSEAPPELAKTGEIKSADELERLNGEVVLQLYEALELRDAEVVQLLIAADLEWWFHGPRSHQHMKRLLTGDDDNFHFLIHSVDAFGPTVIVEGTDLAGAVLWVHAWTVSDGVITQVREYFDTSLTVTRVGSSSSSATTPAAGGHCLPVWQSRLPGSSGRSLPGLVLAI